MRNILVIGVCLVLLTAGPALATKGGNKPPPVDLEAELQEETEVGIAADANLLNQITAEETARQTSDIDLQNQIDNIQLGASGGLKLYDANDQFVGFLVDNSPTGSEEGNYQFSITAYNPTFGGIIYYWQDYDISSDSGGNQLPDGILHYLTDDCTGPSYLKVQNWVSPVTKTLGYIKEVDKYFFVDSLVLAFNSTDIKARFYNSVCEPISYNYSPIYLYEYTEVDSPLNFPLALPLSIEQ